MSFRLVSISPTALRKIRAFVKPSPFTEIGGPMVGYVTSDLELVITDVEGPGPKGKCMPYNVTIDGEHSQRFCDVRFERSSGKVDFVGDWHSHPGICMRPSEGDHQAMKLLAETPGLVPNPVSLIYSSVLSIFRVYEWNSTRKRLISIPHRKLRKDTEQYFPNEQST